MSLPSNAFYPHTSTKTSIVFADKKTHEQIERTPVDAPTGDLLAAHPPMLVHQASALGYRRTQKREHLIDRNDLTGIAERLRAQQIWDTPPARSRRLRRHPTSSSHASTPPTPRGSVAALLQSTRCARSTCSTSAG